MDRRATPGRPYGLLAGFERRLKWGARRTCPYDENLPRGVPQFPLSSPYPIVSKKPEGPPRAPEAPSTVPGTPRREPPCEFLLGVPGSAELRLDRARLRQSVASGSCSRGLVTAVAG